MKLGDPRNKPGRRHPVPFSHPAPVAASVSAPPVMAAPDRIGLAFILVALAVFVRFSYLHEILVVLTGGARLYLLYIFGIPALLATFVAGTLGRALREWPVRLWLAFVFWIAIAVPFSVWVGGSAATLWDYLKIGPAVLLPIAALATNWRQCKIMMWVFAMAGCVALLAANLFNAGDGGRLSLEFGSIRNSNDLAAHLLLLLPFVLWVAISPGLNILRIPAFLAVGYGLNMILKTGSRGALLALIAGVVLFIWKGSSRQRIAAVAILPIAAFTLLAALPRETLIRILTFSISNENEVTREASGSTSTRQYLLEKGLQYTVQHPLFGVGIGRFMEFEGSQEQTLGNHGMYLVPHNSLIQVSSEVGIPAALLFIAAVVSTWRKLSQTFREARRRDYCTDIRVAVFCVMIAILGFSVAAFFLSLAYTFYLPAMAGMSVALSNAATLEFKKRDALAAASSHSATAPAPTPRTPYRPALQPMRHLQGTPISRA